MLFGLFGGENKRNTQLLAAARSGDTDAVKRLLGEGANINTVEPETGVTPLLAALGTGQWATAECLLSRGPDVAAVDAEGKSALYLCVTRGDAGLHVVKLLIAARAPLDAAQKAGDSIGATPVHIACATGANKSLEVLFAAGASATWALPDGATPLHTAALGGNQRTVELLCSAGANVNALKGDKKSPLHNCSITGNVELAEGLIRHGALLDEMDAEGCTPLLRSIMKDHQALVKILLDAGASGDLPMPNDGEPLYPLFIAAMEGKTEIVKALLISGVDPSQKNPGNMSALEAAKQKGHKEVVKLISAAKDAAELRRKIIQAVANQDQKELQTLVKAKGFQFLTVEFRLLVACALGDVNRVRELLAAGANANKPCYDDFGGVTPLVMTVGLSRSADVASLLIEAGADVNNEWSEGTTAIFEATSDQFYDIAKVLIAGGAEVNVCLSNGMTPLMFAVRNGALRCVELFLDAGADVNATENERGVGAFGLALDRLDLSLAEHLLMRGAQPNFGSIETLPLAIAEHGTLAFIREIESRGCQLVRDDQRGRMLSLIHI